MIQLAVTTLSNAAVYGLVAIALNVVYRSGGVLFFGAGHVAAVVGIFYANEVGGSIPGVLVAIAVGSVVALVGYVSCIWFGTTRSISHVSLSLATLGFGLVLEFGAGHIWPKQGFAAPPLIAGRTEVLGTTFATQRLAAVALAAGLIVLVIVVIERTMIGHAMEATAADRELASLYGVRTLVVSASTWIIAGASLGLAGVLQSSIAVVSASSALPLTVFGIVAAVVGGLGSFSRAALGALVTALVQAAFVQYVSPRYSVSLVFFLLLVVLAIRPAGLFSNSRLAERV